MEVIFALEALIIGLVAKLVPVHMREETGGCPGSNLTIAVGGTSVCLNVIKFGDKIETLFWNLSIKGFEYSVLD